ncbi:endonuclease/exonuclease/phosphatase family protein [Streptomyces smyrnaeus]|uniref:endonuclease/exonuclease/phosphatase family protein n=1 Tax=Streptomyces TaxID=1883 RepID=UPI000C183592|nr:MULTISPECIES: endonuclease/exonuclease/phosphatase family protein [unclassified Streptomyces]MBQ0864023.1 endonuclease/exonuclease/phosphatase family protein [Streptomyces sp. RK75]MBQ1120057.1 endonuclease/exonuclease/phosphatase family protein [Streptomyces sp. B15]
MYTGAGTRQDRGAADSGGTAGGRRRGPRHPVIAALSVLTLLVLTVPLAFRAGDEDGPTPVPQLLAFLPWFLAPAWLAALGAALSRRWLVLLWALAVLAGTGWFLRPYGPPAPSDTAARPAKAQFRVLTANLKYGNATPDLVKTVRRERPQIVSLQECDARCAAALRAPALREEYPYRIITGDGGARGSALLSIYPLHRRSEVRGRLSMPGAIADVRGERIALQVAHPMPPEPGRTAAWRVELDRLRAMAAARGKLPTLIAGDFNSSQDHAAFRAILRTGMHDAARMLGNSRTPTWPTRTTPVLGAQIDHVLLSGSLLPVDGQFLDLRGTDHRALLVNVKLV